MRAYTVYTYDDLEQPTHAHTHTKYTMTMALPSVPGCFLLENQMNTFVNGHIIHPANMDTKAIVVLNTNKPTD